MIVNSYTECERCVLSNKDDPYISFDDDGICNHCRGYENQVKALPPTPEEKLVYYNQMISEIKEFGKGRKYDCLLGISGGVDSTYLALKLKEEGVRPLLVHFDNGWNSELAVNNIDNIIKNLGFDLYTYVVDWAEFKNLQLAYIKAGVLDWEIPTDHGFFAMLYQQAFKQKIKHIVSGHNLVTEGILPKCMRWSKLDVPNIKDINAQYGTSKLKTFPLLSFFRHNYYNFIEGFSLHAPLNYINYNKDDAKRMITNELGWRDYGGKHYESIFTRFYQGYVLLEKFGYDKRKAHLSTLINSGQITKEEAKKEISEPGYNPDQLAEDKEYVVKKLGLTMEEFEKIMAEPPRSHLDFKSYETGLYRRHERFMKRIRPITLVVKKFLH